MTTHVFNAEGRCVSEGRNLAVVFSHARRAGGVTRITVDRIAPDSAAGGAIVNVFYRNGWRACTNFADFDHACDWARQRSALSPRVSWFAGCQVECNDRGQA